MAGGGGNHFWPLSREDRPKQFIGLGVSGRTFLQHAYSRCHGLVPEENILVVTLDRYAALVREQLPELPEANLLLEPYGRKTGPCIVYSTYDVLRRDPDAVVAMCPSDLIIEGEDSFRQTVSDAMDYVRANPVLMTIGIVPSRPDPNYGYIQIRGGRKAIDGGQDLYGKARRRARQSVLQERRILLELRYFRVAGRRHPSGDGTLHATHHRAV